MEGFSLLCPHLDTDKMDSAYLSSVSVYSFLPFLLSLSFFCFSITVLLFKKFPICLDLAPDLQRVGYPPFSSFSSLFGHVHLIFTSEELSVPCTLFTSILSLCSRPSLSNSDSYATHFLPFSRPVPLLSFFSPPPHPPSPLSPLISPATYLFAHLPHSLPKPSPPCHLISCPHLQPPKVWTCLPLPPLLSQTEWPCQCWLEPAWPDAQLGLAEACGKESCLF